MDKIWGIILAAGASTRMKKQKMLLPFMEKTIIETVIDNASVILKKNVIVVVGADRQKIIERINVYDAQIAINKDYLKGMLSSVLCGLKILPQTAEAVLVFLGDQPQLPSEVVNKVIKAWKDSSKGIIIPVALGRKGHPLLIDSKYFAEIEKLEHEKGLRSLAEKYAEDVFYVQCDFPEILRDIDTPDEYELEINKYNKHEGKNSI